MIKRDRNHPCIVAWSMGNEEMAIHATEIGVQIYKKMTAIGNLYDTSRPYLYAINADYDRIVKFDRDHGMVQNPVGLNYFVKHDDDIYQTMHNDYPDLCMLNTETTGICSTRDFCLPREDVNLMSPNVEEIIVWENEAFHNKVTCYGSSHPVWGMSPETSWKVHADRPYSAGIFLWTGFDYRGEVFPFDYPATISFFGIIDLCGIPKDWYYYLKAHWTDEIVLHLLPHWNMDIEEGSSVDVWAFTNCDEVELFINNVSQGKQSREKYGHMEWSVTYIKGSIEAIGYRNGIALIKDKKVTAGLPEKLVVTANKTTLLADYEDACIMTAHLEDSEGHMVITSHEVVSFEFEGPCRFLGTGNGDHLGSEPDKEPKRSLFAGKCIAIAGSTFEEGVSKITCSWQDQEVVIELRSEAAETLPVIEAIVANKNIIRDKADADGAF
jgi:beta-galactosidase